MKITCYDSSGSPLNHLTQWDVGQTVTVRGAATEVEPVLHFCNHRSAKALVVPAEVKDGAVIAPIPNILLQEDLPILAYLYYPEGKDSARTLYTITIPVIPRKKPFDYTYIENIEYANWVELANEARTLLDEVSELEKEKQTLLADAAKLESEKQSFLDNAEKALNAIHDLATEDAPAIVCEAFGESITVADAANRPLKGLTIYGKTTQNGTPTPETPVELVSLGPMGETTMTVNSANELVIAMRQIGSLNIDKYFGDYVGRVSYEMDYRIELNGCLDVDPNVFVVRGVDTTGTGVSLLNVKLYISSDTITFGTYDAGGENPISTVCEEGKTYRVKAVLDPDTDTYELYIDGQKVIEGRKLRYNVAAFNGIRLTVHRSGGRTTPLIYYSNISVVGQNAPVFTEEFPDKTLVGWIGGMTVVKEGSINAVVCGKNLLDASGLYSICGVTISVAEDGLVSLNGTAISNGGRTSTNAVVTLEPGKYRLQLYNKDGSLRNNAAAGVFLSDTKTGGAIGRDSRNYTFTERTTVRFGINVSEGATYNDSFYAMLCYSSTDSMVYEPYKAPQTLTASTEDGLPGIPVTSGGNYTDEAGQQWVCDEIDFARGVYVRRIDRIDADTVAARGSYAISASESIPCIEIKRNYALPADTPALCNCYRQINTATIGGNDDINAPVLYSNDFASEADGVLKLTTGTWSYRMAEAYAGKVAIEYKIKVVPENGNFKASAFFRGSPDNTFANVGFKGGVIDLAGSPVSGASYTANTWHTVKIVADPSVHTYDVYLDGALIKIGQTYHNQTNDILKLYFQIGSGTGTVYFDDLTVTKVTDSDDTTGVHGTFKHWQNQITIYDARFTDKETAVSLLSEAGFVALIKLAAPIETALSAEELEHYAALHSNKPNTTAFNDVGAGMKLSYVADTKTYIDNKFAELAAAIVNNS